jgi:hypothetical protein
VLRVPDEVLDHYADLFIRHRVRGLGITFEQFLRVPERYLNEREMLGGERLIVGALLGAVSILAGCQRGSGAEAAASSFVDEYYVRADLARAKTWTEGLATKKIEEEQALLAGVSDDGGARRRTVVYRVLERRDEGERAFFVYAVEIMGQGVPTLDKRSLISVGRSGGVWRVTNFRDFDP